MCAHEQIRHRAISLSILEARIPLARYTELVTYLLDDTRDSVVPFVGAHLAIPLARVEVCRFIGEDSAALADVRHGVGDGQIEKVTNSETEMMVVDVGAMRGGEGGEEERG